MRLAEVILRESQDDYDPQPVPGATEFHGELVRQDIAAWAEANRRVLTDFIHQHCSPWLNQADGAAGYRGVGRFDGLPGFIRDVRTDRTPRDSTQEQNAWYEFVLQSAGSGVKRSNALFVTGREDYAEGYGRPFGVYPMGPIRYTWMEGVSDWGSLLYLSNHTKMNSWIDPQRVIATPEFQGFVKNQLATTNPAYQKAFQEGGAEKLVVKSIEYGWSNGFSTTDPRIFDPDRIRQDVKTDEGLAEAIRTGSEIMVRCEQALYLHPIAYQTIREGL